MGSDGSLDIDIDGAPYDVAHTLGRSDVRHLLDELTSARACPMRVQIEESDGTTYSDIVTPPTEPPETEPGVPPPNDVERSASRYTPGEEVVVAYVVTRGLADNDGRADVHLPPALLATHRGALMLIGPTSGTIELLT